MRVRALALTLSLTLLTPIGFGCATGASARDPLSAGTAKLLLKPGETTQSEVLEAFGGPNIVTGNAAGAETWTYDRMAYETEGASSEAKFFGAGIAGAVPLAGVAWGRASRSSSSSRTATLFLYWEEGRLKDFKYRSASY